MGRARNDRALREPASLQVVPPRRCASEARSVLFPGTATSPSGQDREEVAGAFRREAAAHSREAVAVAAALPKKCTPAGNLGEPAPDSRSRTCTAYIRCRSASAPRRSSRTHCPLLPPSRRGAPRRRRRPHRWPGFPRRRRWRHRAPRPPPCRRRPPSRRWWHLPRWEWCRSAAAPIADTWRHQLGTARSSSSCPAARARSVPLAPWRSLSGEGRPRVADLSSVASLISRGNPHPGLRTALNLRVVAAGALAVIPVTGRV